MLKIAKMLNLECGKIFAVVYDFENLSLFSTSFTQACPAARAESLFSLV